uniref:Uncharacterized protein n=1 Tax=Ananas comosus var. bracteatus TaxID=296719 RepID=A0A6V7QI88_ANACO|nr:unnamed protein product [Ananas comosus var. bracteatus]
MSKVASVDRLLFFTFHLGPSYLDRRDELLKLVRLSRAHSCSAYWAMKVTEETSESVLWDTSLVTPDGAGCVEMGAAATVIPSAETCINDKGDLHKCSPICAVPSGPMVVNIPPLEMSIPHGIPLRRPIPHGRACVA